MKKQIIAIAVLSLTIFSCSNDDDNGGNNTKRAELYATSTANGDITVYDFASGASPTTSTLTTASTSNEGIQYSASQDELYVASRSSFNLNAYSNIEAQLIGTTSAIVGVNGSIDFTSPRALAVNGNSVVVADNGNNQLFVYNRTSSGLSLANTFDISFPVWGVEFVGNDLYVVVDTTGDLAVFNNFLSNSTDGALAASKRITIEGIVRTHGIAYDASDDLLIMTDIGDAGSDSDGGYHLIQNASSQISGVTNGGTLAVASQTRIAGSNTLLGNPVDVTYDTDANVVYIAEIANGGGRILGFPVTASGDATPSVNNMLTSASSVDFYNE
ncbi:NHL repeat-containing protein [Nonlabens ulvanivorans]|uniref:NHL repeat-containing protein n=1 Tax=Nonlabens ulvanivorans TaxID=906888 RepID=A0A084JXW5_NONUL|nr:hypothetical protein [Nonlabens ulvanivorans]KEZ93799.1 hypothetical protein IL45_06270 [Nonlabens ulvanivorans]PRX14403.1 NHL repeat-containing protein [Nonlabens ulvanivorans]